MACLVLFSIIRSLFYFCTFLFLLVEKYNLFIYLSFLYKNGIIKTENKIENCCRIQNNNIDNLSISMTSPAQTLPPPSYNQYQQQQQDSIDQINETPQPTAPLPPPPTYNSIVNKS